MFVEGILFTPGFLKKTLCSMKCCLESDTQPLSKVKANTNRSGPTTHKMVKINKNGCQ